MPPRKTRFRSTFLSGNREARQAVPALPLCAATPAHVHKKLAVSLGAAVRLGILALARHSAGNRGARQATKTSTSRGPPWRTARRPGSCSEEAVSWFGFLSPRAGKGIKKDRSYLRTPLKMGFGRLFASGQSPTGYFFGGYLPAATLESSCIGPFGPCAENPSDRIIRDTPQTRTNSPVMLPGRLKNHIKRRITAKKKRGKSSKEACLFRFGMYIEIIKIN